MRTEKWAKEKGLINTYINADDPEKAKLEVAKLKGKGYKAYVIRMEHNPLSRGGWKDYRYIFACQNYRLEMKIESAEKSLEEKIDYLNKLGQKHFTELCEAHTAVVDAKKDLEKCIQAKKDIAALDLLPRKF